MTVRCKAAAADGLIARIYDSDADEVLAVGAHKGQTASDWSHIKLTGFITGQSSYNLVPQYALLVAGDDVDVWATSVPVEFQVIELKVN